MGDALRREVLHVFKKLHRTRLNTFKGDEYALQARNKINEEYRKYKNVTNPAAITELNRFAQEVEQEVRTNVIQAVEVEPRKFALKITTDTTLIDNVPYKDNIEECGNQSKSNCKTSVPPNKTPQQQGAELGVLTPGVHQGDNSSSEGGRRPSPLRGLFEEKEVLQGPSIGRREIAWQSIDSCCRLDT